MRAARRELLGSLGIAAIVAALAGCTHNIGDPCTSNVDCSPAGDRFCDRSAPGGYCTVEGCDLNTCPDSEPCVRFFTTLQDPADVCHPDSSLPNARADCPSADDRCIADATSVDGGAPLGHCAPESTERRWCQHGCQSDGDCRPGYQCRSTAPGVGHIPVLPGALPVPTLNDPAGTPVSFCVFIG